MVKFNLKDFDGLSARAEGTLETFNCYIISKAKFHFSLYWANVRSKFEGGVQGQIFAAS